MASVPPSPLPGQIVSSPEVVARKLPDRSSLRAEPTLEEPWARGRSPTDGEDEPSGAPASRGARAPAGRTLARADSDDDEPSAPRVALKRRPATARPARSATGEAKSVTRIQSAVRGHVERRRLRRELSAAGGTMVPVPGTGTVRGKAGWYQREKDVYFMSPEPGGFGSWICLDGPYDELFVRQQLARAAADPAPDLSAALERRGRRRPSRRQLERDVVAVQAAVRGHLARVTLARQRSAVSGIMHAVKGTGTVQGKEGWYMSGPWCFYALPMLSGEWLTLRGPLADVELRHTLARLQLRAARWCGGQSDRSATRIQALVRGHQLRRHRQREVAQRIAEKTGMLTAVGGTRQGHTGWYQHEHCVYYMRPSDKVAGGWERLVGPLDLAHWERLTIRGVSIACIGTNQGESGRYLDAETGLVGHWQVHGHQWRLLKRERRRNTTPEPIPLIDRPISAPTTFGEREEEFMADISDCNGPTTGVVPDGWVAWLAGLIWGRSGPSRASNQVGVAPPADDLV